MPTGFFDDPMLQMLFFILFIGMTIYIFLQTSQQNKKKEPPRKIYTVIHCTVTGEEEKREYNEGDYIGKEVGECGDEDGMGKKVIKAIYAEKVDLQDTKAGRRPRKNL